MQIQTKYKNIDLHPFAASDDAPGPPAGDKSSIQNDVSLSSDISRSVLEISADISSENMSLNYAL